MLVSGRQACELLADSGVTRRHARKVLAAGLAGEPVRTRSAHLFHEGAVRALVARRTVPWADVLERCRAGIFISRRELSATAPRQEQLTSVSGDWHAISPYTWMGLKWQVEDYGRLPFIATVSGFVVLGADIVGTDRGRQLRLTTPGTWFELLDGARIKSWPGRPWDLILGPREKIAA